MADPKRFFNVIQSIDDNDGQASEADLINALFADYHALTLPKIQEYIGDVSREEARMYIHYLSNVNIAGHNTSLIEKMKVPKLNYYHYIIGW